MYVRQQTPFNYDQLKVRSFTIKIDSTIRTHQQSRSTRNGVTMNRNMYVRRYIEKEPPRP